MHVTTARARRPIDGLRDWAARDPERLALIDDATSMTFAELVAYVEATGAAARAAMRTAPPTTYLPVVVDRSVGSAAAILACLLGRVRFFPVDAAASRELKQALAARAGSPRCFLLGARGDIDFPGAAPLDVSDARAATRAAGTGDEPDDSDTALILFTSGSTGTPKGVVLTWRALERRWRSRDDEYAAFGDDRRQPLVIPLDSSWGVAKVADVASGFTERIVEVARLRPAEFLQGMARFEPTAMAIPSQLARLLAQLPTRLVVPLASVRRLHIAAEGFRYEHMDGLRSTFRPETSVVHSLASSEGGREIATTFPLGRAPRSGPVHLGVPLFPDSLRVVPVPGMADGIGEVHVGGAIADGYLDDPELTQARFYTDDDGHRWWRSHDLVSLDDTGQFRHEGRLDDVVKVGGKLASPSDVTAVLVGIEGIAGAITIPVVTRGNTRLVAHVEVGAETALTLDEVHRTLSTRLPAHAVPSAVMRHARLPVTNRGKVDRRSLMDGPFEPW